MRLRAAYGRRRKPVVTAEFSLGSSGVRADLAVFADRTIGVEIKTARDTLRRLPSQMAAYARYFDRVVAIVAPCHLTNLRSDDLFGASVWTYDDKGALSVLRVGVAKSVDKDILCDMLTKAERRRDDFRASMEARYAVTSDHFWSSVSRRPIRPSDLQLLSRFADNRIQARRSAEERLARWSHWLAAQDSLEGA
jgi:hypothetical protein